MTAFLLALLACDPADDPLLDTASNACYAMCNTASTLCEAAWPKFDGDYDACLSACADAADEDAWPSCFDGRLGDSPSYQTCSDALAICGVQPCDPNAQDMDPDACPE